jgi:hypothetical protein
MRAALRHPAGHPARVDLQAWIDQILDLHGCSQRLSHGGVLLQFRRRHLRQMQRELGQRPAARLAQWLNACQLQDARTGLVIRSSPRPGRVRHPA